jgi:hypothetical protein
MTVWTSRQPVRHAIVPAEGEDNVILVDIGSHPNIDPQLIGTTLKEVIG